MSRASAPVSAVLLVGVCVVLAAGVGAAFTSHALRPPPRYVTLDATATADGWVELVHSGGPALDVRRLDVHVTVDGVPLRHQPPVPFFASRGFHGGPRGPFNIAADPAWTAGELAGFRVAGTNAPSLVPGAEVVVTLTVNGWVVAEVETAVVRR